MDLSALDTSDMANAGAVLHLNGPTGQPLFEDDGETPVTITLLGEDSDVVAKANNEAANRFLRSAMGATQQITAEVSKANEIKKFAAATVAWSGIVVDGQSVPCNAANAAVLYRRFSWIADQIRLFISDRANFLKPSPTA
uniref:Tail protein n=1 Tax=viral metagenome TaxID=1070528 RepID=A0A6H1ZDH5_9ZZZZ